MPGVTGAVIAVVDDHDRIDLTGQLLGGADTSAPGHLRQSVDDLVITGGRSHPRPVALLDQPGKRSNVSRLPGDQADPHDRHLLTGQQAAQRRQPAARPALVESARPGRVAEASGRRNAAGTLRTTARSAGSEQTAPTR